MFKCIFLGGGFLIRYQKTEANIDSEKSKIDIKTTTSNLVKFQMAFFAFFVLF